MLYSLFKDIQQTTKLLISFLKYHYKLKSSVKIMPQTYFGDINDFLDDENTNQLNPTLPKSLKVENAHTPQF